MITGLWILLAGSTSASSDAVRDEAALRDALRAIGSSHPCAEELRLAWLRDRLADGASVEEAIEQLPRALRDGEPPPRATVELHGLRAEDPLDRRVAELVARTLEDPCLRVISREEVESFLESEADLIYLATSRPDDARAVLRRRLGDLLVVVSVSGASIAVDSVYGVVTHLARYEISATLLRVIDGRIVGVTSRLSEARRIHADAAMEAALQDAVEKTVAEVKSIAFREILEAMVGLRLQVVEIAGDPNVPERLMGVLRESGVATARRDGPSASAAIVIPVPDPSLSESLEAAGWEVVDRRLGRWLLREAARGDGAIRPLTWIAVGGATGGLVVLAWAWRRRKVAMVVAANERPLPTPAGRDPSPT